MRLKICKGTTRVVVLIPWLGVAIKFPLLRLRTAIKNCLFVFKHDKSFLMLCRNFFDPYWCVGVAENWREFVFWIETKHLFLQPTWFSFLGLFNVQKLGQPLKVNEIDLLAQMQILTEWYCWESSHTFGELKNYCVDQDGKVRLIDYASRGAQPVILLFGGRCYREFSIQFKCTGDTDRQLMAAGIGYSAYRRQLQTEERIRSKS